MLRRLIDRIYKKDRTEQAEGAGAPAQAAPGGDDVSSVEPGEKPAARADTSAVEPSPEDEAGGGGEAAPDTGAPADEETLKARVIENLKKVYDPEIPVNIYELGLIYEVSPEPSGMVYVKMTLTAPNCPAAGILPGQVESQARAAEGVRDVRLDLVFDPPWTPERMSEAARLELGML